MNAAQQQARKYSVMTLRGVVFDGKAVPAFTEIQCTRTELAILSNAKRGVKMDKDGDYKTVVAEAKAAQGDQGGKKSA